MNPDQYFHFISSINNIEYSISLFSDHTFSLGYILPSVLYFTWGRCSFDKIDELDLEYLGFPKDLFIELKRAVRRYKVLRVFE